jgi:hypothetical protein
MTDLRKSAEALIEHWEAGEFQNCTGDMAGHIADLKEALQPKVEHFPKKLSEINQNIVEYCFTPRTSTEIAIHVKTTMSAIYRHLRLLQRLGLLEKMQVNKPTGHNHGVTFKATGKSIEDGWIPEYMSARPMVMGVRL